MLFIAFMAVVSSLFFRQEVQRRGYNGKAAARFPLAAGVVALILYWALDAAAAFGLAQVKIDSQIALAIRYLTNFFVLALFIAAILKNWLSIRRLPQRAAKPQAKDGE